MQAYRPLAGQLFNISFISIWDELFGNDSYEVVEDIPLINGLELALHSPQIPPYIMNALLNLAEFMVSHSIIEPFVVLTSLFHDITLALSVVCTAIP